MSDVASDGLAGMPTGPELAMRLALLDPHDVPDGQLLELLNAEARQLAHQQARSWAVMSEIARRNPFPNLPGGAVWTPAQVFDNAVDEIRAELLLNRRAAGTEVSHAYLVADLAPVMHALLAGEIDRARAIRFADGCHDLTDQQTAVLLAELLPEAGQVTASELAEKIKRIAMALDPDWAQRRYLQAIREQKVIGYLNRDGSAVVSGQNLPADEAAFACARVDALADAAKRAGATAKIDTLRATVFLGLLDGRFHGLSQTAIVTELLQQFPKQDVPNQQPAPAAQPVAETLPEPTPEPAAEPGPAPEPEPEPEPGWQLLHLPIARGWRVERRDQNSFLAISPLGRHHVLTPQPVTPPLAHCGWLEQLDDPDPP